MVVDPHQSIHQDILVAVGLQIALFTETNELLFQVRHEFFSVGEFSLNYFFGSVSRSVRFLFHDGRGRILVVLYFFGYRLGYHQNAVLCSFFFWRHFGYDNVLRLFNRIIFRIVILGNSHNSLGTPAIVPRRQISHRHHTNLFEQRTGVITQSLQRRHGRSENLTKGHGFVSFIDRLIDIHPAGIGTAVRRFRLGELCNGTCGDVVFVCCQIG
mmetsp:Transcript_4150/g.4271  ORF Transcript_4150/g.4271 Transcript_4150/m.4271 type:complete len:213 (+) Transcript_4150:248-886(+)